MLRDYKVISTLSAQCYGLVIDFIISGILHGPLSTQKLDSNRSHDYSLPHGCLFDYCLPHASYLAILMDIATITLALTFK